ncbi:MAG: HlyD family efflux transporter periplasmic adaptor subunit [Candidatus Promineifilaceae bacterium]
MNKKTILFLLLISLLAAACDRPENSGTPPSVAVEDGSPTATPRPTEAVTSGTTVLADGQLVSVSPPLALSFTTSGRLLELHVRAGDTVSEGDLIATLDDKALQDQVATAELNVSEAENGLAQAQLSLDNLLNWEPDELAVEAAEANVAVAQANYEDAQVQDASAGNNITSAQVQLNQAERALADAQEAYDTAWDPARDWELNDPFRKDRLEAERENTERALQQAQESLSVARANYNLTAAGINRDSALSAEASLVSAQQALEQAKTGPTDSDISAAELQVAQAELSLEQAQMSLAQAQQSVEDAQLVAPWSGTVLSVEIAQGALVGNGTPIITLIDTNNVEFHTNNLSERDLAQIEVGQPVEITLKSYPNDPIDGVVSRVAPQASELLGDAATFTVVVSLNETELDLLIGMTGRAEIQPE